MEQSMEMGVTHTFEIASITKVLLNKKSDYLGLEDLAGKIPQHSILW
jgi:hypothetical protein